MQERMVVTGSKQESKGIILEMVEWEPLLKGKAKHW